VRGLNLERFDQRLDATLSQPLAVAFSGGGDSLAALIASVAWANACGRPVLALHVDHRLQPNSGAWRDFAADAAERLGAQFRALTWDDAKPSRGLAAAARRARHAMIAEAARAAGASVVVFGHTADDLAEAALMRSEGSTLGALGVWRPSPVWPEGRGVMLFRPLLRARRVDIRAALRAAGWTWIDDPANADLRSPRARARMALDPARPAPAPDADCAGAARLALAAEADPWGAIRLDRGGLLAAARPAAERVLAAAMLSTGGGERPPRRRSLARLLERLEAGDDVTATLAGARLQARGNTILVAREAGEAARGGLAEAFLPAAAPTVWDGRFELRAGCAPSAVRALGGRGKQLVAAERRRLAAAPARARAALPLVQGPDGAWTCPILARGAGAEARSLAGERFLAACGARPREAATLAGVTIRARGEMPIGALSLSPSGSFLEGLRRQ